LQHKKIASHSVLRGKQDKPTETGKGEARWKSSPKSTDLTL